MSLVLYSAIVLRIIVPLILISSFLCAQESAGNGPDWIQDTDIQPDSSPDWIAPDTDTPTVPALPEQQVTALRALAFTLDFNSKARVMETLSVLQADGMLSHEDVGPVDLLSFLATESYDYQVIRDGRTINDFPTIRARAVALLGDVGGTEAAVTIERVLRHETDTSVLATAVTAASRASTEPSPELTRTLTTLVNRMNVLRRPDNALAWAVVSSIDAFLDQGARIDDPDLFRALISIVQGSYSTDVRRAAASVIDRLRRQS